MLCEGTNDRLTAFLVTFDVGTALRHKDEKYSCRVVLTLPKRDGLTVQAKLFCTMSSQASLDQTRVGINDGMEISLGDGVLFVKCPYSGPVFRPTSLRVLSSVFRAAVPLHSARDSSKVYIGGEITLRLDKPLPETQDFWEAKRSGNS